MSPQDDFVILNQISRELVFTFSHTRISRYRETRKTCIHSEIADLASVLSASGPYAIKYYIFFNITNATTLLVPSENRKSETNVYFSNTNVVFNLTKGGENV